MILVGGIQHDLTRIKWSSPLKTQVTINSKIVVACFDDGASISVISRLLCDSLGFVTNGDTLQLVDCDNNSSGQRAEIVMEVPIKIQPGQHIRPDRMCVQDHVNEDLLILGVPWFQAYGIGSDIGNSLIKVPTTSGVVKLQVFTTHIPGRLKEEYSFYF